MNQKISQSQSLMNLFTPTYPLPHYIIKFDPLHIQLYGAPSVLFDLIIKVVHTNLFILMNIINMKTFAAAATNQLLNIFKTII